MGQPTKTAEDYRAEAAAAERQAAESFDRCDTDGFMSQWASGLTAEVARANARIVEAGGTAEFPALFDLDGNLVAAKLIDGRYGAVWGLLADDDPGSEITDWVSAFPKRATTIERKGYREGVVSAPAGAKTWAPADARGLSGATQVTVRVYRRDGGFSRNVKIVENGR